MPKYFNDAIIGNSKILSSLNKKGDILRLYYPNIDYFQLIDRYSLGIFSNNKINWFNDGGFVSQYYDGNILYTELNVDGVNVTLRDYVLLDKNVLVRAIKFMKPSNLIVYSKLNSDINKHVSGMVVDNTLIQYCQDMYMATFSNKDMYKYRINNAHVSLEAPNFDMDDYIGMSQDSVVSYEEISEITLYISLNSTLDNCLNTVKWCKKQHENLLFKSTKDYWTKYIEKLTKSELIKSINKINEKEIMLRTIYMYALLSNKETGAILASPDVDETFSKCGRYGFCWPRDALFINDALSILGMDELLKKFYNTWATKAQLENGLFEQRYYSNGELAPSWGLQIDETAAILIGLSRHVDYIPLEKLIIKATIALMNFVDDKGLSKPCFDIWEERKGVHLYSTASIYEALKVSYEMIKKIDSVRYSELLEKINVLVPRIKESIKNNFIKDGHLVRSLDDSNVDISLLSVVVPFEIFEPNDEVILNTVSEIERTLHMANGGYMRYQWDSYIGGNTWIISSLWMAMYHIKIGNISRAKELFNWVTEHADNLYFLPEQIEREGHGTAWVSQLSWSHAMYVIVKNALLGTSLESASEGK